MTRPNPWTQFADIAAKEYQELLKRDMIPILQGLNLAKPEISSKEGEEPHQPLWATVSLLGPGYRGVSSNGAENWGKAFSVLDRVRAHVYVRMSGNP